MLLIILPFYSGHQCSLTLGVTPPKLLFFLPKIFPRRIQHQKGGLHSRLSLLSFQTNQRPCQKVKPRQLGGQQAEPTFATQPTECRARSGQAPGRTAPPPHICRFRSRPGDPASPRLPLRPRRPRDSARRAHPGDHSPCWAPASSSSRTRISRSRRNRGMGKEEEELERGGRGRERGSAARAGAAAAARTRRP